MAGAHSARRSAARGRSRRGQFVDFHEVSFFVEEMRKAPQELQAGIRAAVKQGGKVTTDEIRKRASWSSRIPNAVDVKASFATRGAGIRISVSRVKAPHARPYEGIASRGGSFRHPVYGNREVWVSQAARPFFRPAIEATRQQFIDSMTDALLRTLPQKG